MPFFSSQDVLRQIPVFHQGAEPVFNHLFCHHDLRVCLDHIRYLEQVIIQQMTHYRMKTTSADIFYFLIDQKSQPCNLLNRIISEI